MGGAVALGVRTHAAHGQEPGGWATYVVLGGSAGAPDILARGRMQLCDAAIEGSEQPFHHAATIDLTAAEAHIRRCTASSRELAGQALEAIVAAHGALQGCRILTGPPRSLPPLPTIQATHSLQHAAERAFYRDVVLDAAIAKDIRAQLVLEKDIPTLAERLPGGATTHRERLAAFGRQVGSPWGQDEKLAATAAWLVHALRQPA